MRKRKQVLIFCESIATAMEIKCLLEIRGPYKGVIAEDFEHVEQLMRNELLDPYLFIGEVGMTGEANRLAQLFSSTPSLLFSRTIDIKYERANFATHFIPGRLCDPWQILDRVHILAQRKRGPKKGRA